MTPEDQTRALLEDAVSDVEPRPALAAIRARAGRSPRRSWVWSAGGAALATAATVAVVVSLGSTGPGSPAPGPGDQSSSPPVAGPTKAVYFVGATGAGLRLFPERHRTASPALALDELVAKAVAGTATDVDYHSPWPEGTVMQRAQVSDGVLSVDLSGPVVDRPDGTSPADAAMALQQLVYTAQAAAGSRLPVTFLVDGAPASTVLGEPTAEPVAAAAADETLASVSVTSPVDGARVTSPFTVAGRAAAFEANVQWELLRGSIVVKRGFATATECCTLSPYTFTVTAPPGAYTLVVHDEDPSGGEGHPGTKDTKQVTVG